MNFNVHDKYVGQHAFFGASQWHWLNWSDDILAARYVSKYAAEIGTAIHELAAYCIKKRIELKESDTNLIDIWLSQKAIPSNVYNSEEILKRLIPYVKDAIGFHMTPEVILFYSEFCFGTADTIYFSEKNMQLRIHDYKSGNIAAHIEQLLIYAALFCLEYKKDPFKLKLIELRIYQSNEVIVHNPEPNVVKDIMDKIVDNDNKLRILLERGIR